MVVEFVPLIQRPLPSPIYIDCSVFVEYLDNGRPHHGMALEFIEDACGDPRIVVMTSQVIWSEIPNAGFKLLLEARADEIGDAQYVGKMLSRPHEVDIEKIWDDLRDFSRRFEELVNEAQIQVIKPERSIRMRAYDLQKEHRLRSQDSIHAASCLVRNCNDLAVIDYDFHNLGPRIWTPVKYHYQPKGMSPYQDVPAAG